MDESDGEGRGVGRGDGGRGAEMVVLICVTISEQLTNLRLATLVTSKVHK